MTTLALIRCIYESSRYRLKVFHTVIIDKGATCGNTPDEEQYLVYCKCVGRTPDIDNRRFATHSFGIGSTKSRGVARVDIPGGSLSLTFHILIMEADLQLLLCLDEIDKLGLYRNNLMERLYNSTSVQALNTKRQFGHPFLYWNVTDKYLFSKGEPRLLHRLFGIPKVEVRTTCLRSLELVM